MSSQIFATICSLLLLVSTYAMPIVDTTNNQVDEIETSTIFKQIFNHTSTEDLVDNKTESVLNVTDMAVVTTTTTNIPNSTDLNVTVEGRGITAKLVYSTTYSSGSSSDSGLSGGAIAGIIIGVIVLICCLGACGCFKSGHWETRKVWVQH